MQTVLLEYISFVVDLWGNTVPYWNVAIIHYTDSWQSTSNPADG